MLDKHTEYKRKYMKKLRKTLRLLAADPYLAETDDLAVEMYKWNKVADEGLFVVYSRSHGKEGWNTPYCKYVWINFRWRSKWRMAEAINEVLHYCRHPEKF